MTKSSAVTARIAPLSSPASSAGAFVVEAEAITVETTQRIELIDLTDRVLAFVRGRQVREGLLSVCSMHTTCTAFINEAQPALHADILRFLEKTVDRDANWLHNDPDHSDCDRMNADAHLRALLLGHSLTLQVSGHDLVLGQWQRVIVGELDGPRTRTIRLQVMGTT